MFEAWKAGNVYGMTAEAMIRGNARAEITGGHDSHGDTEYRYTFAGDKLTVEQRVGGWDEDARWSPFFHGFWWTFVNIHIDRERHPDFQDLRNVKREYVDEIHNPASLQKAINDDLNLLGVWAATGHNTGANWDSLLKRVKVGQEHLNPYTFSGPKWREESQQVAA
jgi:hypothetical protein